MRNNFWLAGVAVEYFYGEALYGMEESLRRLRKWRIVTMSFPVAGFVMIMLCAALWSQAPPISIEDRRRIEIMGIEPDLAMSRLEYKIEKLTQSLVDLRVEMAVITAKLDLIIAAAGLGFASQAFFYFYQLRLRRTLKDIDR